MKEACFAPKELGCYVHIPFCNGKCPYCDFYSLPRAMELREAYAVLCAERLLEAASRGMRWRTLYLGGGTPSVLEPRQLDRILAAAGKALLPEAELTVECNPSSVTPALCEVLRARGVNRVSLGLQSVVERERQILGRQSGGKEVARAVTLIKQAGIQNLSLDVMLGIPFQTERSLAGTLAFCRDTGAAHISAYLLHIEAGTAFARETPPGLPDEESQRSLYLYACEWLERAGYAQYEISNFARPGYESRHNLLYWSCGAYFAVGPGAHGYTDGVRWHCAPDLAAFLAGAPPVVDGPGGDWAERAMLRLRLCEGLREADGIPQATRLAAEMLEPHGLVRSDERGIRLTREGFLLSNMVIGRLLRDI
ncbi:MAG: radical SAM family heme chaperone HemW [Oscillospiraceae bacterium]|nr:radical SAM family heme chaperone HemW [Oscillospiraceae bacterium]